MTPATAYDAKGLLKASIRDNDPVLFFEHKNLYRRIQEELPEEDYIVPLGKASIRREGSDMTFVTYSAALYPSLAAAEKLKEQEGMEGEGIDLRTLRPLDWAAIFQSVQKTNKVIIIHEDRKTGGIGGEIAARIAEEVFEYLDGPVCRVASEDTHYAFSPPLEEFILPNVEKIITKAKALAAY